MIDTRTDNYASHRWGRVDDCIRCIDCEIGRWKGAEMRCPA